jgi:hypothetical protein
VEEIRRQRNTTNDNLLQDRLLQCAKIYLRKTLQTPLATILVANLMLEIEKAVEKQLDLLNKVKLMEASETVM